MPKRIYYEGEDPETNIIYKYELREDGSAELCDCISEMPKTVKLPSVINGHIVRSIGQNLFGENPNLLSVELPDSLTEIDNVSFWYCTNLREIRIPNGVKVIEYGTFFGCENLERVVLPESLERIGEDVFYGCNLTSLHIPDSLREISEGTFCYCDIQTIDVAADHPAFFVEGHALIQKSNQFLLYYMSTENVTNYSVPNGIKRIGKNAFVGCHELLRVKVPDGVEQIGESAFEDCKNLVEISLPESLEVIGSRAFVSCENLKKISFPQSVREIGNTAFWKCKNLCEIKFPKSLEKIGEHAFRDCTGLDRIVIPKNVIEIGEAVFMDSRINEIVLSPDNDHFLLENGMLIDKGKQILLASVSRETPADLTVPDSVARIGYGAFSSCTGVRTVGLPNSITSIGTDAFYHCTDLTAIQLPDSLVTIGSDVFSNCPRFTEVSISASLEKIPDRAFYNCENLIKITIPEGVKEIEYTAFRGCINLKNILIPASVYHISNHWVISDDDANNPVLTVYPGSSAERDCRNHHIPFQYPAGMSPAENPKIEGDVLSFHFENRDIQDLEKINRYLADFEVSSLAFSGSPKGYLDTTKNFDHDGKVVSVNYRYGFDRVSFLFAKNEAEGLCRYQIDIAVFPESDQMDTTEFYKEWSEAHPDSLIRSIMKISFGAEGAFVVLFSDKPV